MREIPELFMAVSSKCSPRFPKVISEDSSTARGKATGVMLMLKYIINSAKTLKPRSFPTNSSKYLSIYWVSSMKTTTRNVRIKGPIKDCKINLSNFFIIVTRCRCRLSVWGKIQLQISKGEI